MSWLVCCCCCCWKKKKSGGGDASDPVAEDEGLNAKDNNANVNNNDLTKADPIRTSTIEELKSKLGAKETDETEAMIPETQRSHGPPQPHLNEDGLIIPKKLINPVLDSKEMQKLQKELRFNQKQGKQFHEKSELAIVLEKVKDNKAKKELEKFNAAKKPELEKVIANRAKRMEENNSPIQNEDDRSLNKDLLQVKAKLKATRDCK